MINRRSFLQAALGGTAGLGLAPLLSAAPAFAQQPAKGTGGGAARYRLPTKWGMGGAPLGNNFDAFPNRQGVDAVAAAWDAGCRYFDTSPWYGLGLSEHRFGMFLSEKPRRDYVLSTKVGRILTAGKPKDKVQNFRKPLPFDYKYDYSAAATRRSIEDSLQRLGIESIDIVFIHDLNRGNKDLGDKWTEHFEIAAKGAMPELAKMKREGLIKGWGLGVNEPEPILRALEVAEPDVVLAATQYSLITHEEALDKLLPACQQRGVGVVIGAPLNAGFLAGSDRYDYSGTFPRGAKAKRSRMQEIARAHGTDLRTAALHFCAAHPAVAAVIPGARNSQQSRENQESMKARVPAAFWQQLKAEKLIAAHAPVPTESARVSSL